MNRAERAAAMLSNSGTQRSRLICVCVSSHFFAFAAFFLVKPEVFSPKIDCFPRSLEIDSRVWRAGWWTGFERVESLRFAF